jgi:hypothetical protein
MTSLPLAEAVQAHRLLEGRAVTGRLPWCHSHGWRGAALHLAHRRGLLT